MTNGDDPIIPRKRNQNEIMALLQGHSGTIPNSFFEEMIGGLPKREWLAGIALQGLIAGSQGNSPWNEKQFAIGAINLADALLNELNKGLK